MAFRYQGSGWRVAHSLRTFGDQIMALRGHTNSYTVDGTLGDADHSNRVSDHNPDPNGIVRALDFYEWEPGRVDEVFERIQLAKDPRTKYVIHADRMFSSYPTSTYPAWTWRPYNGINGHENHGHLSVVADSRADQTHPWPMPGQEGDDMDFIIQVLKGQNMAFYRALKAKTGVPGGNADYWGSDYTGQKPNDSEWRAAADDLFGAALQAGVFTEPGQGPVGPVGPRGATGPQGPKGDPGAANESQIRNLAADEILRRLNNG